MKRYTHYFCPHLDSCCGSSPGLKPCKACLGMDRWAVRRHTYRLDLHPFCQSPCPVHRVIQTGSKFLILHWWCLLKLIYLTLFQRIIRLIGTWTSSKPRNSPKAQSKISKGPQDRTGSCTTWWFQTDRRQSSRTSDSPFCDTFTQLSQENLHYYCILYSGILYINALDVEWLWLLLASNVFFYVSLIRIYLTINIFVTPTCQMQLK